MSEEEKKAIKYLEHLRKYVAGSDEEEFVVLALNLIEKQNKRIEELERDNKIRNDIGCGLMKELLVNYIPKSVIKEKIEELEQQTSTINDKAISKKYSHTQFARECCIGMLKELLEG